MHRMQEVWLWSGGMYSRWWPKSTAPTLWIHIYVPVNYIISFWHRGRDVLLSISIFLKKNVLEHKRHSGQMQRGIVGRACTGLSPSIVQYAFFLFAIKPMAVWQHTEYTRISHELLLLCVNQMFCKHLALHWQPCHKWYFSSLIQVPILSEKILWTGTQKNLCRRSFQKNRLQCELQTDDSH